MIRELEKGSEKIAADLKSKVPTPNAGISVEGLY
jgi:hypothetical protein